MSSTILFDEGGPRAHARNRALTVVATVLILGVVAWTITALSEKGQFAPERWLPFVQADIWVNYILPGLQGTIVAAVLSIVFAMVLGVILGVGRMAPNRLVSRLCGSIVELCRAVPILLLMVFLFQLYSAYAVFDSDYLALGAVVTALTIGNAAVIAEVVRAGVLALPRGQTEAALTLGMHRGQVMRLILLPQALRSMLPPLISQMIVVLKDTALGYQITYLEIVRQGVQAGSSFGNYLPSLMVVAALMVVINLSLSQVASTVSARLGRTRTAGAGAVREPVTVPEDLTVGRPR